MPSIAGLKAIILWILLFAGMQGKAQFAVVYEQADNEIVQVDYLSEPDSSGRITNYFIQEIARSIPKRFDFTSYKYSFRQVLRVIRMQDGSYEASIDINEAHCSGDVMYKGFDISDVLFPNHITFEAVLYNKYKAEIATFRAHHSSLHWGYNKIGLKTFSDTIRQPAFTFNVIQRKLSFDSLALKSFEKKLKLIDKYYLSKAVISQGMKKLETFDFSNIDMIIVYDIMLKDVERQVEELYQLDFPGNLNLSVNDPIGYIDLFTEFSDRCRQVRNTEEASLSSLDKIYYNHGMDLLARENTGKAVLYFKRSCNYNPYYVPSWYQRAKILYLHDSVPEAADIVQSVLTTMNPDPAMSDSVYQFASVILKALQQQGSDFLKLQKYNESIAVIERGIKFCTGTPGMKCDEQIYKDYAASKYGLYQSFLTVSDKAIQSGRPDLAEVYLNAARSYQKANVNEIIGDAGADAVTGRLAKYLVKKGDTLCSRRKYEQALASYQKAESLCDSADDPLCKEGIDKGYRRVFTDLYNQKISEASNVLKTGSPDKAELLVEEARSFQIEHQQYVPSAYSADTLFLRIQQSRYNSLIQTGALSLHYLNYEDGLPLLEKAMLISAKYPVVKDVRLDSLLPAVARPVLMTRLQEINALLDKEETDSSGRLLEAVGKRMENCRLEKDSVLSPLFASAQERLEAAVCSKSGAQFSEMEARAGETAGKLDFIQAQALYTECLNFIRNYPNCHQDTAAAYERFKRTSLPAAYQQMLGKAEEKLKAGDTLGYFAGYNESEDFFGEYRVGYYGLIHKPLTEICILSTNLNFKIKGIQYFLKDGKPDRALDVLQSLETIEKPSATVLALQRETGRALAVAEHQANPSADPALLLAEKKVTTRWFATFRKSYLTAWKTSSR